MKAPYLECGKIASLHGFSGAFRADVYDTTPARLLGAKRVFIKVGENFTEYPVERASRQKEQVLLKLKGLESDTAVLPFKGQTLYLKREDITLREGEHLLADIIGLPVFHAETGEKIGTLTDADTSRPQTLYEITTAKGVYSVPAVPAFIKEIDEENGVKLLPIEGLLEV